MKAKHLQFIVGVAVGAVLFGGGSVLAASLTVDPSAQTFFLRDRQVRLTAYSINDNNYVKLRDIGQLVGFDVSWRAGDNAVIINPDIPYYDDTISSELPQQPISSSEANPSVFTDELTSQVYDAIRDTVVHRDAILAGSYQPVSMGNVKRYSAVDEAVAAIGGYAVYELVESGDGYTCGVKCPEPYRAAADHTRAFINSISELPQEQQAREIVWYVCDRLTYTPSYTDVSKVLAGDEVQNGSCMTYAYCFRFLCQRAGIPCILVHSDIHEWNEVYIDGRWWSVDLTGDDLGNDVSLRDYITVLHDASELYGSEYTDAAPHVTAFAKELLVPGSTK